MSETEKQEEGQAAKPLDKMTVVELREAAKEEIPGITGISGMKKDQLLHIMDLAFREGLAEGLRIGGGGAIPITDLTHIPEIIEHAGHRWEKGTCH